MRFLGTHLEGKLSREVVHPTGMHETQGVADCLSAQHALACGWTNTPIGQRGCHDTSRLAGHFDGAQLQWRNQTIKPERRGVSSFTRRERW